MDTTVYFQRTMHRTIPARIDRLPLSAEVWRIMLLAGIAWLVESYDIGVIGNVLPSLQAYFHLDTFSVGLLAIASTLGIVLAVIPADWLADRIGRKRILVFGTAWYAFFSFLFGFSQNMALVLACGILLSFFGIGIDPVIKIYGAERYPTRMRETGVGFFEGVGRLFGGALAPFIMSFVLASSGVPGSYIFVACLAIVGVVAVVVLGSETKGQTVEQTSAESFA